MRSIASLCCAVLFVVIAFACSEGVSDAASPRDAASGETPPVAVASAPYLEQSPEAMAALARGDLDPTTVSSHCAFCARVVTADDAQAVAVDQGIVWYGVWEDAVAEVRRSGRPLMVHFGSPRVMQVCGVW